MTHIILHTPGGKARLVNASKIIYANEVKAEGVTVTAIYLEPAGKSFSVTETPEEIQELINEDPNECAKSLVSWLRAIS